MSMIQYSISKICKSTHFNASNSVQEYFETEEQQQHGGICLDGLPIIWALEISNTKLSETRSSSKNCRLLPSGSQNISLEKAGV